MKLLLLYLICYFASGSASTILSEKLSSLRKSRHKRQATTGLCEREERYPCTSTGTSGRPIYGSCPFGTCIIGYAPVQTFCTRRVRECCVGFTNRNGACIRTIQASTCGRQNAPTVLSQQSGVITSPNFPLTYLNNMNCNWLIAIPAGATLNLQVTTLSLEQPWSQCFFCEPICLGDRLVIQDSIQGVTHCGVKNNVPLFISRDRAVTIRFITNAYYTYSGFRIMYTLENFITTTEATTPITTEATTTEYIPPSTTTATTKATTTTTEYIPPVITSAITESTTPGTQYVPPSTTPTTRAPDTTTSEYIPPPTVETGAGSGGEYIAPTIVSELPFETTGDSSGTSRTPTAYVSTTDISTTTRRVVRTFNRSCPVGQLFMEEAPYCKERCDNGTITRIDCLPEFEFLPGRPRCVCPQDRPVLFGRTCIPRPLCALFFQPSFACPDGRIPTRCLPTCTLTCQNYDSSRERCLRLPPSSQCVSGCMCPPSAPIVNRDGACVSAAVCSIPPKPKVITCGIQHYQPNARIIGGRRALRGSWPWAVQIIKRTGFEEETTFQCGGAVICANWVLTAAHCFQRDSLFGFDLHPLTYTIRIGKHRRRAVQRSNQIIVQHPETIIPHPGYDASRTINDIALVKLRQPLKMTNTIRPACIPSIVNAISLDSNSHDLPTGSSCFVVGWGSTNGKGPSNTELKQAKLRLQPRSYCEGFYRNFIARTSFCVGGVGIEDTCQGDSGGPLLCRHQNRWFVDGITSYGKDCGVPGQPSVYTRVSSFRLWIRQHTGNDCGKPMTEFPLAA